MNRKALDELGLARQTQRFYPWFPAGELRPSDDPPDVWLDSEGERIAIEVTRLFHPPEQGVRHPRPQLVAFQQQVMARAEELARAEGLPPLDVLVYFWNREPLKGVKDTARSLVQFVRQHPVEFCETFDRYEVPQGFGVIRIAQPEANQVPRWKTGDGGAERILTQEFLAAAIKRKNDDLPRYRTNWDRCWLIVATTLFPLSASFSVPDAIRESAFEFDFDKVLLLSERSGVFDLRRTTVEERV